MVKQTSIKDLTDFAAAAQHQFDSMTPASERKERGHFGTPGPIAEFMAEMFTRIPRGTIRILDPGAGVGTLSAALCQRILGLRPTRHIQLELWESDPKLISPLRRTMDYCRKSLSESGHHLDYTICVDDFILANTPINLFRDVKKDSFDLVILNPPYFKMRKESLHAKAMEHVVHGQPNIYSFFMSVAADLLRSGGEMVAITPRSYFNGLYFKKFRKWFFNRMTIRHIHVFESRSEAFQNDNVLQENVIVLGEKHGRQGDIVLTSSYGSKLQDLMRETATYANVIDGSTGDQIVRVTSNHFERQIVAAMDALPLRFRSLGFEISTGPVVTFRSTEHLREFRSELTAPLLWMHNVKPFVTLFPKNTTKPCHIEMTERSMRILLPSKRYVLLKRFTAKEEKKRLVAGIMEPQDSYSEWVGLENHLNYVYRKGGEITKTEALGLAALFNSALVDRYFRSISGNTQVNATEIRSMPMPDAQILRRIGEDVEQATDRLGRTIDFIVGRALRLPEPLVQHLCEGTR